MSALVGMISTFLPGSTDTHGRGGMKVLICAALSVALHGVVLSARVTTPSLREAGHAPAMQSGESAGSGMTRVRMIQQPTTASITSTDTPQHSEKPARTRPIASTLSLAAINPKATVGTTADAPAQDRDIWKTAANGASQFSEDLAAIEPTLMINTSDSISPEPFDGRDYIPRSLLSVPPSPRTPIALDVPQGEFAPERYVGILSLFIDERGKVQHVVADGPSLPPAFEQAAREAFMAAQFEPGQMSGKAVKSRQRVEAMFDNTIAFAPR